MSAYFYLCCKKCEISLNLGKKIAIESESIVMQGFFSEKQRAWVSDGRTWLAIQRFLQDHEGHELVFSSDEVFPLMQIYDSADGDDLLASSV